MERLVTQMVTEYYQADGVTSLVDYYGFRDLAGRSRSDLENEIIKQIVNQAPQIERWRIFPYVQMHEFEGLLFSDINHFEWVIEGWSEEIKSLLQEIRNDFSSPEEINNSRETAPSKRLEKIFPDGIYSKTEHGPIIAEAIGIDVIRKYCPQFNQWVRQLEQFTS
ncbi:DUF4276 family protein [Ectothiorhodospiraceae bacterium BW-2]|nr:DUF4276 family protein [Ectothiorhodospiraceae bacterium BW-2]